ncbi:MAG: PaaI family thioesterase [Pseudomonadota bacterium]
MARDPKALSHPQIQRVETSFAAQGLMATLGATLEALGPGSSRIAAPILPGSRQQQGFAHAGLTFAIGDSAAGYAALTTMPEGFEVVTAEMKINLLAPGLGDRLVAEGRVLKPGKRLIVTQADVYADKGGTRRHIATLLGTMVPVPA